MSIAICKSLKVRTLVIDRALIYCTNQVRQTSPHIAAIKPSGYTSAIAYST